jgi:anaerobic glycerol-3-phosphate dehydrogenase
MTFALPESETASSARRRSRWRVVRAAGLRAGRLSDQASPAGFKRVGFPAILGLERATEVWGDLQDRLGLPVFEIQTLPPSVPGIRLFNAFKRALAGAGVQLLLDMTATQGIVEGRAVSGVVVPTVTGRQAIYQAGRYIRNPEGLRRRPRLIPWRVSEAVLAYP